MGTLSEFVKNSAFTYTLKGGYEGGGWSDESANFEFVGDGKYTYTFTAAQTGEFRFRVKTSYKTKEELCPDVDPTTKRKKLTSTPEDVKYANPNDNSAASIKDNYWFYSVTAGKNIHLLCPSNIFRLPMVVIIILVNSLLFQKRLLLLR